MARTASHYDVLGVPPSASVEDMKAAYKMAALRAHPDKQNPGGCGGGTAEFAAIQQAWEVLRDAELRTKYDHQLSLLQTAANTPVSEEITLDEMEEDELDGQAWRCYPCRCGGAYEMPQDEVDSTLVGCILLGCSGCSLYISVSLPQGA
eukprot:jgi/Tetstr1/453149/TSEL_040169.t1